jgi:hypothetical protein
MLKARTNDEYVQTDTVAWQDFPEEFHSGGVKWKLLRVSPEMAFWTVLFFCPDKSVLQPHIHHGPAEGWIFDGSIEARGGPENGGVLGVKDGFVYEAAGARHDETKMRADTTFILQMVGPLTWTTTDGRQVVQTWEDAQRLWEKQTASVAVTA